jgi:adenine-specific DNA-methyltransferase
VSARIAEDEVRALIAEVRRSTTSKNPMRVRRAYQQVLEALEPEEPGAWRDGVDIVGAAYQQLLTGAQRRAAGQFFTPFWAGEVMSSWLFSEPTTLLADPGCGSGGLLIPAARHRDRGAAALLGIDVDPFAIAMAETNKRLRGLNGCDLRVGNFLVDPIHDQPDAVICNPPYARYNGISRGRRTKIHEHLSQVFGMRFSQRCSLQALFVLRALEVSSENARLAFITPSDWLDVNYGDEVKRCLLERAHVEAVVLLEATHLFFSGARTTAAITLIRKGARTCPSRVIRVSRKLPEPASLLKALRGHSDHEELTTEMVSLHSETKWARRVPKHNRGVRLGDVARVHRGVATGANHYFCLTEEMRRERGIRKRQLRACLSSPRHFGDATITDDVLNMLPNHVRRWLVDSNDPNAEQTLSPLGKYLRRGRRLKVHKGYLVSRRSPWYSQEQRNDAPIVFTYLNKDRPRFLRNQAGAVPLNNWLVVSPAEGVNIEELFTALSSTTVQRQLRELARFYGGGLWKLEPSELERVRLPLTFRRPHRSAEKRSVAIDSEDY